MNKQDNLTAERLRELLHYDPETGEFTWRVSRGGAAKVGSIAGTVKTSKGYRNIWIGANYKAHRLAWLYVHGVWPEAQIDHINHIKTDNRIANLRQVTNGQNMQNRSQQRNSPSGFKGVLGRSKSGRWPAKIAANGKQYWLGHFDSPETGRTNADMLRDEIADVMAQCEVTITTLMLDREYIKQRAFRKMDQMAEWEKLVEGIEP